MSDTLDQDRRRQAPPRRRPQGAASAAHGRGAGARAADSPRGFAKALKAAIAAGRYGLIAEIKKASPSKGLIRAGLRPAGPRPGLRARRRHLPLGADRRALLPGQGRVPDARRARATKLPVLRKDFMIDPYQVAEARALGADCILLIMACLDDAAGGASWRELAHDWGMDVLVEVHDAAELERALDDRQRPDRRQQPQPQDPRGRPRHHRAARAAWCRRTACWWPRAGSARRPTSLRMAKVGASAFLIGESFMRKPDVEAAVRDILVQQAA